jgi:inosine-uridine nucleoside N-ribohydrolase
LTLTLVSNSSIIVRGPFDRIILTWAPGVDDVLAMLLALAAKPEEVEVMLLSVTYGNVPVQRYIT